MNAEQLFELIMSKQGGSFTGQNIPCESVEAWEEAEKRLLLVFGENKDLVAWLNETVATRLQFPAPAEPTVDGISEQQPSNQQTVRDYVALTKLKKELESKLEDVKSRLSELEQPVLDYFTDAGIQRQSVDGMTVYMARELWAGTTGDKQATCNALKESGWGDFVQEGFNTQSVSAKVREVAKELESEGGIVTVENIMSTLPLPLQSTLKVSEVFKVKTRKG